jgi:hypothetical protein
MRLYFQRIFTPHEYQYIACQKMFNYAQRLAKE